MFILTDAASQDAVASAPMTLTGSEFTPIDSDMAFSTGSDTAIDRPAVEAFLTSDKTGKAPTRTSVHRWGQLVRNADGSTSMVRPTRGGSVTRLLDGEKLSDDHSVFIIDTKGPGIYEWVNLNEAGHEAVMEARYQPMAESGSASRR